MNDNNTGTGFLNLDSAVKFLEKKLGKQESRRDYYTSGFVMIRLDSENGKTYRPINLKDGKWHIGDPPKPLPLYRIDRLIDKPYVIVVEGPKCVEVLRKKFNITNVTTSSHGAKCASQSNWTPLLGHNIILIRDEDKDGEHYVKSVPKILRKLDPQIKIKIVRLSGLRPDTGEDIVDWINKGGTRNELFKLIFNTQPMPLEGIHPTHISDLMKEPVVKKSWVVENLLMSGGFSLISAKPKVGKSTLARTIALCVSQGKPWLNKPSKKGPVVYLALEDKRDEIKIAFQLMGAKKEDPLYIFTGDLPQNPNDHLRSVIIRDKPILLIIDTLAIFTKIKDFNDYGKVTLALVPIRALARETGTHICGIHHAGKGDRSLVDSVLGSIALTAIPDTTFEIKRDKKYRTISSIVRYGTELPETTLNMDPDTGLITAGPLREEVSQSDIEKDIIFLLSKQASPITEKEIKDNVSGKNETRVKALRNLVKSNRVIRTGKGGAKDRYKYSLPIQP